MRIIKVFIAIVLLCLPNVYVYAHYTFTNSLRVPRDRVTQRMSATMRALLKLDNDTLHNLLLLGLCEKVKMGLEWMQTSYDPLENTFRGHLDIDKERFHQPNLVNLLAYNPMMEACLYRDNFKKWGTSFEIPDTRIIQMYKDAAEWLIKNRMYTNPTLDFSGIKEDKPHDGKTQVWTKYTATFVILLCRLSDIMQAQGKTEEAEKYKEIAQKCGKFLEQAFKHDCAMVFYSLDREDDAGEWSSHGWNTFARNASALFTLGKPEEAKKWLGYGLAQQAEDNCFYLRRIRVDDVILQTYDSDIAGTVLRGLIDAYSETPDSKYLLSAQAFADWHLRIMNPNGSIYLRYVKGYPDWNFDGIFCDQEVSLAQSYKENVAPGSPDLRKRLIGPGDVSNIGDQMLRLYQLTRERRYLEGSLKALCYILTQQVTNPDDTNGIAGTDLSSDRMYKIARGGFWSWDSYPDGERMDLSMSCDQAKWHNLFILHWLLALENGSVSLRIDEMHTLQSYISPRAEDLEKLLRMLKVLSKGS